MTDLPPNDPWEFWEDLGFRILECLSRIEGFDDERKGCNCFNVTEALYGGAYNNLAVELEAYGEEHAVPGLTAIRATELANQALRAAARVRLALLTRFLLAFYEVEGGDPEGDKLFPECTDEDDSSKEQETPQQNSPASEEDALLGNLQIPAVNLRRYVEQQLHTEMAALLKTWHAILNILPELAENQQQAFSITTQFNQLEEIHQDLTKHLQITQYEKSTPGQGQLLQTNVGDSEIESSDQQWRRVCRLPTQIALRWVLKIAPQALIRKEPDITLSEARQDYGSASAAWEAYRYVIVHVGKEQEAAICFVKKGIWLLLTRPRRYYTHSD